MGSDVAITSVFVFRVARRLPVDHSIGGWSRGVEAIGKDLPDPLLRERVDEVIRCIRHRGDSRHVTQFGHVPRAVRCDNGTEFDGSFSMLLR